MTEEAEDLEAGSLNLKELPLEEKKRLLELLLAKKEIEESSPIDRYAPHEKQLPFHESQARIRLFLGGNRAGKSTAGVAEDLWHVLGRHPHREVSIPAKVWVCGPDFPNWARTVMIPKLKAMVPKGAVSKIAKNHEGVETSWEFKNGSTLELKAYTQDSTAFESADIDACHFDEPPPKPIFDAATRGLVDRNGPIWLTMTPISEPWVYRDLFLKAKTDKSSDIAVFQSSIYDNPNISEAGIKAFEGTIAQDYKAARLLGEFKQLQGRVFKAFNPKVHILDGFWPQPGWPIYRGVDPHVYGNKNQAALWMTLTPGGDYVFFDEVWEDLTIEQLRDRILEHDHRPGYEVNLRMSVIDTSINIREAITHRNFRDLLTSPGKYGKKLWFTMAEKKNLILPGLEFLNSLLEPRPDPRTGEMRPKVFVSSRCRRLIEEFELHTWHEPRDVEKQGITEKESKTYNDMISIARYIFNLDPEFQRRPGTPLRLITKSGGYV